MSSSNPSNESALSKILAENVSEDRAPISPADLEEALQDLWESVGDTGGPEGVAIVGDDWRGHLFRSADGVYRGYLWHTTRGVFAAQMPAGGPVTIEGWDDA